MSESVILCEGYHDRAFWDGWLTFMGCDGSGFRPGTPGFPKNDPWGKQVHGRGQVAYHSKNGGFVRILPCNGKGKILYEARVLLNARATRRLLRLVINVDLDTSGSGLASAASGQRQQDVLYQVQQIDASAIINVDGDIEMDSGATKISLLRWEANDPPAPGLPDQQCLERLVSAALAAAYPTRAASVQNWLDARPDLPGADPKEHAWSYMAGWYADFGCEAFYSNLWNDPRVAAELEARLRSSGAWQTAALLAS